MDLLAFKVDASNWKEEWKVRFWPAFCRMGNRSSRREADLALAPDATPEHDSEASCQRQEDAGRYKEYADKRHASPPNARVASRTSLARPGRSGRTRASGHPDVHGLHGAQFHAASKAVPQRVDALRLAMVVSVPGEHTQEHYSKEPDEHKACVHGSGGRW